MDEYPPDTAELIAGVRTLALRDLLRLRLTRPLVQPNPAAGADWVATVPAGVMWELVGCQGFLTTSVAAGNRNPMLVVKDASGVEVGRYAPSATLAASLSVTFGWWAGLGASTVVGRNQSPLPTPPLALAPEQTVGPITSALDAADQWTLVSVTVREWSIGQLYWIADILGRELGFEGPALPPSMYAGSIAE